MRAATGTEQPTTAGADTSRGGAARTLAALYARPTGTARSPYDPPTLIGVLRVLDWLGRGATVAEVAEETGLPAAAVYGAALELEDHGLARLAHDGGAVRAAGVGVRITPAGCAFLYELTNTTIAKEGRRGS